MLFPWGFYIQKDLSPKIILPDWAARFDPQKCFILRNVKKMSNSCFWKFI